MLAETGTKKREVCTQQLVFEKISQKKEIDNQVFDWQNGRLTVLNHHLSIPYPVWISVDF